MKNLNPTLWRTCRMLTGTNRVRLLRELHDRPGQSVSQLAAAVGIGPSDASQELRRIQSRGLLKSERTQGRVFYRLEADPQVASAGPLLKALRTALASLPPKQDADIARIAAGLAWSRRVAMAHALLGGPKTSTELSVELRLSSFAVYSHLRILQKAGWIQQKNGRMHLVPPDHPLGRVLAQLLRTA